MDPVWGFAMGGSAMSDNISLAVGDGTRRMTYAELAQARGISLASASGSRVAMLGPDRPEMTVLSA